MANTHNNQDATVQNEIGSNCFFLPHRLANPYSKVAAMMGASQYQSVKRPGAIMLCYWTRDNLNICCDWSECDLHLDIYSALLKFQQKERSALSERERTQIHSSDWSNQVLEQVQANEASVNNTLQ